MDKGRIIYRMGLLVWMIAGLSGCVSSTATTATTASASSAPSGFVRWMNPDIQAAWSSGYMGQGTTVIVVDEFSAGSLQGTLSASKDRSTHGGWTSLQAQMIAPEASIKQVDFSKARAEGYALGPGLNIINNSYSALGDAKRNAGYLPPLEAGTVAHAKAGSAVVVKSAGNDAVPIGTVVDGQNDFLGIELIGAPSAIFVGALSTNGSAAAKARMATYSNTAGGNPLVQEKFLVVGVDSATMGLSGTSFAAPIISGYAAILGSKFKTATPTQISNQLLDTARTDTIANYDIAVHGQGEASIARALAPLSLQ